MNKLSEILILNKEDILETLSDISKYCANKAHASNYENNDDFFMELNNEITNFISEAKNAEFPDKLPAPWAYYINLGISSFEIGIGILNNQVFILKNHENMPVVIDNIFSNTDNSSITRGIELLPQYSLLTHPVKKISVEEYAIKYKLSPITVREYIRKGNIVGVSKLGRQYFVPVLAKKRSSSEQNYVVAYDYINTPIDIPLKFKYLDDENINTIILERFKDFGAKRYTRAKLTIEYKNNNHDAIQLSIKESKELETYLQSAPFLKYNSCYDYKLYVWEKLRIKHTDKVSFNYTLDISFDPIILKSTVQ